MKSLQVMATIPEADQQYYGDLEVLRSAAGWYVGTKYNNPEVPGFQEPGSRDTDYFESEEDAKFVLNALERCHEYYTKANKHLSYIDNVQIVVSAFDIILNQVGLNNRHVGYRLTP